MLAVALLLAAASAEAQFSGGNGTSTNAYQVATAADLNNIRNYKGSLPSTYIYYRQTADINLSGYPNWLPIGTNSGSTACVHYDGDGYAISNLNINRSADFNVGLFGHLSGSVRNLALLSGTVQANSYVGALAGVLYNGSISNCSSSVSVRGSYAGGLVGLNQNGVLRNVSVRGAVVSGSDIIGGLVGYASGGSLTYSFASAVITNGSNAGGLVGFASPLPTVSACYWDTQVSGKTNSAVVGATGGLSTAAMMQRTSFSGWDFNTRWQLYKGHSYPYLRSLADTVADPVLVPGSGAYPGSSVTVTATCATAGSTIHYTMGFGQTPNDSTTNTIASGGTIEVLILETLNTVAWAPYMNPSAIISATYDPASQAAEPTASPPAGSYAGTNLTVTISSLTSNAVIRYTLDGSEPDVSSMVVPPLGEVTLPLTSTPTTLKAKAWADGLNPSSTMIADYEQMPTAATPTFNPDGGLFTGSTVVVTFSCSTPGAMIHYTTDGSTPSTTNAWVSSGSSVVVPLGNTLKARAWASGMVESQIKSADYSSAGAVATPIFNPDGGAIAAGFVAVVVTNATAGATIYYTTDGAEPDLLSPSVVNGQSVRVPVPGTLKAKAFANGLNASVVKSAAFTTAGVVTTPSFSPAGGTVGTLVTLSCVISGAVIHYTTNGVDPTASSPSVSSGAQVFVPSPSTLKAKAFKSGSFPSPVAVAYYGEFAGGTGTVNDPYRVATAVHLDNTRNHLNSHFVLADDIDLGVSPWNTGSGWGLIGSLSGAFTGSMDGQGHVVSNLFIDRPAENAIGLFGYVQGSCQIRNLGLVGGSVNGKQYVGALVGYSYGIISNCYSTVDVVGNRYVGGLVGGNGDFSRCQDSYAVGSVTANGSSPAFLGGLIGSVLQSTVTRCYAVGSVQAMASAGGLIGGNNASTITNSYWDKETSGLTSSQGGTAKTTVEMQQQATFAGWDFTNVWRIEEGVDYPRLRAFDQSTSAIPDAWLIRFYGSVAAAPENSVKGDPLVWEYIAGTDPTDPVSRFAVTDAASMVGTLSMQAGSVTGRVYRLLSRAALTAGDWQPASGVAAQNGTGAPLTFEVPEPPVRTFYRLSVELE